MEVMQLVTDKTVNKGVWPYGRYDFDGWELAYLKHHDIDERTIQLELVQGKFFSKSFFETEQAVMFNVAYELGFEDASDLYY
jgi:hypothetical protein